MERSPELPDLVLDVTPISQHGLFPMAEGDENRACWYAATMMVLAFRSPLLPLELTNVATTARLWQNHGVQPYHLDRLADEVGLEHSPSRVLFPRMGAAQWHAALSTLGPLMIVVNGRHLIVVCGINKDSQGWRIVFNDPLTGARHSQVLLNFNAGVDWRMPVLFRRSVHRPPLPLIQPVHAPFDVRY